MKKILVTGAGGFVGSYLIQELMSAGKSVGATKLPHESIRIGVYDKNNEQKYAQKRFKCL